MIRMFDVIDEIDAIDVYEMQTSFNNSKFLQF